MIYGTNYRYQSLVSHIAQTQDGMSKLQYSVSTGNKAQTFADQPSAASLVQYKSLVEYQTQTIANATMAQVRLKLVESAMSGLDDLAVSARRASSVPGYEEANARNLQQLSKQWLASAVDYLNTKGDNGFIFGGLRTDERPVTYADDLLDSDWTTSPGGSPAPGTPNGFFAVTTNPGPPATATPDVPAAFSTATSSEYRDYYYNGGAGVDPTTGASDDGLKVRVDRNSSVSVGFSAAEPGFEKLLRGLHLLATTPAVDKQAANYDEQLASYELYMESAFALLDEAATDIRAIRQRGAAALSFVNDKLEAHKTQLADQQKIVDELQGADRTESIVKLQALQTNLEASYQVTSQLKDYSLVKYLR